MMKDLVALLLAISSSVIAVGKNEQPNILIFLADDLNWHDLGPYGNQSVNTPELDAFAGEGMVLEQAFNSAPMCAPTRMSLYSGIHPVRNGAWPNHSRSYDWVKSMPDYLRPAGYRVALVGKTHEAPHRNFDFTFLGGRHHDDGDGNDLDLRAAEAFVALESGEPWCLVVASNQSHTPWNRGNADRYKPEDIWIPPYLIDTPETRSAMTRYYAEIAYLDAQFGECLRILEENGMQENTFVLFLSEQGAQLPFGKWTCYEAGLRSAAIARWPGQIEAGTRNSTIAQYVDVLPTLLEMAGIGPDAAIDLDGTSLLPLLRGEAYPSEQFAYGVQTSVGTPHGALNPDEGPPGPYGSRTVRSPRFRLIWNLQSEETYYNQAIERGDAFKSWVALAKAGNDSARQRVAAYRHHSEFELYDHDSDPWELKNLAYNSDYLEVRTELLDRLQRWMEQQGDLGAATEIAGSERMAGPGGRR